MHRLNTPVPLSRRSLLRFGGSAFAATAILGPLAINAGAQTAAQGTPFSFDMLVENARQLAAEPFAAPEKLGAPFSDLDYDSYRNVQFNRENARWDGPDARAVVHAYHPGWLFDSTVALFEVSDGQATALQFNSDDFLYYENAQDLIPQNMDLAGVAGFRINAPLNAPDRFDEVLSFLGASYFRALGKDNGYGLSARGLAVNTATSEAEEFPRFSAFWLERPVAGAQNVTIYALLDSQSVTGAYKFVLRPGETTELDVACQLFFRDAVEQVGIAPLTSMFLFAPNDEGDFDDYRTRVHDSEALIVNSGDGTLFRVLSNPPRLGNSYFALQSPQSFGLVQRHRAFDDYLDAGAHYELRPSLMVEPLNDWGAGRLRLIEIPSDLEANDNIVAFWIPQQTFEAGDSLNVSYRLHWGMNPPGSKSQLAQISRSLAGHGGVAGVKPQTNTRKFVIDFEDGALRELNADADVEAQVSISNGTLVEQILSKVEGYDSLWRLVLEISGDSGNTVEMSAVLFSAEERLSETWVYQWLRQ